MSIVVDGTISPYLWTGRQYVLGDLMDPGLFGGGDLTGDAVHIVWTQGNGISADLTINGVTVVIFAPTEGFYAPYSFVTSTSQNITAGTTDTGLSGTLDSFVPTLEQPLGGPLGLGGAFHFTGGQKLDGYFFVTSMVDDSVLPVPGPLIGEGLFSGFVVILFAVWMVGRRMGCF